MEKEPIQEQKPLQLDESTKETQTTQRNQWYKSKITWLMVAALVLVTSGLIIMLNKNGQKQETSQSQQNTNGNEQNSTNNASNNSTNSAVSANSTNTTETAAKCDTGLTYFSSKSFGAAFCYPTEWGKASVMDAKIDTADKGYREAVRFSANTMFIVGGVSEDWSTEVGRDIGCQEPSNTVPPLSEYDTEWHDIQGSGMAVEYAIRSLAGTGGGYDMSETVSDLLWVGVCAQGHKVINGSRYKVISAAFYRDFSEAAGINSPKAHMDNPNVLFSVTQRQQLDKLLSSVSKY